jgi:hypothetical protein
MPSVIARRLARRTTAVLAVIAATATGLVAAPLAPAAAADRVVTVAGSLQSELGCPADWQPSCAASELPLVSGTTYRRDFTVPAGSYELKVTINGSWDENYGADGVRDGANIPLRVAGPARLRFTYDDSTHRVSFTPLDVAGDAVTAADRALASPSLRNDLTRERFYFVMADRFANGNPANDQGGLTGGRSVTGFDPADKGYYHGGDLGGIIAKLDYIKSLGTTG